MRQGILPQYELAGILLDPLEDEEKQLQALDRRKPTPLRQKQENLRAKEYREQLLQARIDAGW